MNTTATVSVSEINRLRHITGAGMMDCKKALIEANGDSDKAIEILRKKGQKIVANRSSHDAKEGIVLAKISADEKKGILVSVNCETDFVARNEEFSAYVNTISDLAITKSPNTIDELKSFPFGNGFSVEDKLNELLIKIGEKINISHYETINAEQVVAYNHPGNKLAAIVGFNKKISNEVARNIAMQVAAMAPIAVDKEGIDATVIEREMEIGRELARKEGKPDNVIEKIATGKLNKFYQEVTLLNQEFIRENKKTVRQYISEIDKELSVTEFKRIVLG
ncbi:MAG: translation elongation factor Ts [Bacteroidota bacterium]